MATINMLACRCALQVRNFSTTTNLCKILPPAWIGDRKPFRHRQFENEDVLSDLPGKSFIEKMAERKVVDPELSKPVNIGVPIPQYAKNTKEMRTLLRQNNKSSELEKAARHRTLKVPLDEVQSEWMKESRPRHIQRIAEHYGIYEHLFGGAIFYPCTNIEIHYDYDEEYITPVYTGNKITPQEAQIVPSVDYEADATSFYTLVMTNPDGHLVDNKSEYLHWMIGNIPGSAVADGDVLCDYLQPFPPRGTGFHRYVFILYKQDKRIDYSDEKCSPNCLKQRTFKTVEFFRKHQEHLTPVGLNFFQSDYDDTVRNVYHNILNMREPAFEYRFDPPYHPPQKMYPHKEPFDRYYDRYRDKKDLAEEVMRMKLDMVSPFAPHPPRPKYPLIHREKKYKASWLKRREEHMHRRIEQFKDLP